MIKSLCVAAGAIFLASLGAAVLVIVGAACLWLGVGFNGGSVDRYVVQEDGVTRSIEWRGIGGRSGLCLYFTQDGAV